MALSNAQRQARHREKLKTGQRVRIEARVAPDTAATLDRLAALWTCSKTEALGRALFNAWRQAEGSLPDHEPAGLEPSGTSPGRLPEGDKALPAINHPPEASTPPAEAPQRGPGPQTIALLEGGGRKAGDERPERDHGLFQPAQPVRRHDLCRHPEPAERGGLPDCLQGGNSADAGPGAELDSDGSEFERKGRADAGRSGQGQMDRPPSQGPGAEMKASQGLFVSRAQKP